MKTHAALSLSLSALVLGGVTVGCTQGGIASASSRSEAASTGQASRDAGRAAKLLARGRAAEAVRLAESAAALKPQEADYRVLLGQAYVRSGRFVSARQAFAEALTLRPEDGKAALNLALMQIGAGDWAEARDILLSHQASIPAADRGLAMALAGDPAGAVTVLTEAARAAKGDAKVRQNLALASALAGNWSAARVIVAADMTPDQAEARLAEWNAFAHPAAKADQVAALLGVRPVEDAEQPASLALNAAPVSVPVAKTETAAIAPAVEPPVASAPVARTVAFTPAHPVVQPLPAAKPAPAKLAAVAPATRTLPAAAPTRGEWYVQIGAFRSVAVARASWAGAVRREAALRGRVPESASFRARAGDLFRLSVGGFARADAASFCRTYRAKGGACFVRPGAGDQVASWVRKDAVQLASR